MIDAAGQPAPPRPVPPVAFDASMLRLLADSVPISIAYYDSAQLRCWFANRRYTEFFGQTPGDIIGRSIRDIIGEQAWAAIEPQVRQAAAGQAVNYVREQVLASGEPRMIEVDLLPHFDGAGRQRGLFVLINDITKRWQIERAMRDSEERSARFAHASNEGLVFHQQGVVTDANEALLQLIGYGLPEVVGRSVLDFMPERHWPLARERLRQLSEQPYELTVRHRLGHEIAVEIAGKTIVSGGGSARLAVVRDITARQQAQRQIEFLAHHDPLTQLPNRVHLTHRLEQTLALAQRSGLHTALLFIDLDNFKSVNDTHGHHAGDQLLRETARRLRAGVRDSDVVARLGGDEFLVVLADIASGRDAGTVAAKLLKAVGAAVQLDDGHEVNVSPSIGISLFPQDGQTPDELIRNADAAMYHAKASGRNNHQFFEASMRERVIALAARERQLRAALAKGEFELHYQPQWRLNEGTLAGIDALLRWRHPERGLLAPEQFLEFAEAHGLLGSIGIWMVRQACEQLAEWRREGLAQAPIAVSLSAIELRQPGVVGAIEQALADSGLSPHRLELGISESILADLSDQALKTLDQLKALGVALVLTDFDAGYSFLRFVKRCPLDKLKIDHRLIQEIEVDQDDFALATAVVQVAGNTHMLSVAAEVDTPAQLDSVRRMGCDYWQGGLGGGAVEAGQARDWLVPGFRPEVMQQQDPARLGPGDAQGR